MLVPKNAYYWGPSNFFSDTKTEENIPSFFTSEIQSYCRYAIPLLEDIQFLLTAGQENEPTQAENEEDWTEVTQKQAQ